MYSAAGLTTLIIAIIAGTIIGNIVQLRYLIGNPTMKSPVIRFGSLAVAIILMIFVVSRLPDQPATSDLMQYGLGWVVIAFLVSFVRPPQPLPPRTPQEEQDPAASEDENAMIEDSRPDQGNR